MAQKTFVNSGTIEKLDTVLDYASFYTRALKNTPFRLTYVDVFAGSGDLPAQEGTPLLEGISDVSEIQGSARRSLSIEQPFDSYLFADLNSKRAAELSALVDTTYPELSHRIKVEKADANAVIEDFCSSMGPKDRALVFLDPFGNNVSWSSLEALAKTGRVDVWYLFPSWLGVARQITHDGTINPDAVHSIERMFGPYDWRAACLRPSSSTVQGSLFDNPTEPRDEKIATVESVSRFMLECLDGIFKGGVSKGWRPIGPRGRVYYSLMFACANPSKKANTLAMRVANQIMTRR